MTIINTNGTGGGVWNDGATWDGGVIPSDTDKVVVKIGDTLIVEGTCICGDGTRTTSNISDDAQLIIEAGGTLKASRTADSYLGVKGQIYLKSTSTDNPVIDYGKEGDIIPDDISCVINMNEEQSNLLGYYNGLYAIYYNNNFYPKISFKGGIERIRNTFLTSYSASGTNTINVNNLTNWKVGDKIRLSPRYNAVSDESPITNHNFETSEIASIDGNTITLVDNLLYDHGYDEEEDKESSAVSNMTSNLIFTGGGDDRLFYTMRLTRIELTFEDLVFEYANNSYNYNSCPIRIDYMGIYSFGNIRRIAMIGDNKGIDYKHLQGFIYFFAPLNDYGIDVNDISLIGIESTGAYNLYRGLINYYGGRPMDLVNVVIMAGINYRGDKGIDAYQQPVNIIDCKVIGFNTSYNIHNNVDITTTNSYAIGGQYGYTTYNGTSINYDLKIRYNSYIAYMYGGRRGSSKVYRADFMDKHILGSYDNFDFVSLGTSVPDGNHINLIDIQNNTLLQQEFQSFGRVYNNINLIRNDEYSIGLSSISDDGYVKYNINFNSEIGDNIIVGLYIRNISYYIGELLISINQGTNTLKEETIDLTTLNEDEWTLISIYATSNKNITTDFNIKYKGNGGEISITDFIIPATKDEKSQARAIWSELQYENNITGSMGEKLNQLENYNDTITQDKLDIIKTETDKIQPEIIDNKDEFKATGFATQNPPSQNLDDYKADLSGLSSDVNIIQVNGVAIDTIDDFKATETISSNMRGTDNANTIEPDNNSISLIKDKTDILENYDDTDINTKLDNIPTKTLEDDERIKLFDLENFDSSSIDEKLIMSERLLIASTRIEGTELTLYDDDGDIQSYDLLDVNGNPSNENVFYKKKQ